jgi:hypothetical protein
MKWRVVSNALNNSKATYSRTGPARADRLCERSRRLQLTALEQLAEFIRNCYRSRTVDLVELLFSAVLMLVDFLVGSVSSSREARLWELPEFFRRSVSVEKSMLGIFFEPKAKR